MSGDQYGRYDQGFVVPPMPAAPPPAPADGVRAVAVAVLNLSGLGLGYALVRRWILMLLCLAATAVLLFVALPADPDGVPVFALVLYVAFLIGVAAHGAVVGLRTRLAWPPSAPLALVLGLVLLVAPAGGVVAYDGARDEATQQMLLDRLDEADRLVEAAGRRAFTSAQSDYREALEVYEDLSADHPDSRAAAKVPARMKTYYATVGAAYEKGDYCEAVAPLDYLRTVPKKMPETDLSGLKDWPDDRLATSLYECASDGLASGQSTWASQFGQLLTTFPDSEQATKVEPAVGSAVSAKVKGLGGSDPCTVVEQLKSLSGQIENITAEDASVADALTKDADRAASSAGSGTYNCGVDQYRDGDFESAQTTMEEYVSGHKSAKNAALAKKIAIAAEVAQTVPAAGKKLPTTRTGGSISVTVQNDSPDDITVMYTGPVTGSFTLKACGSCKAYSFASTISPGFKPCNANKNYPERTISLPVGTTYFVHKPNGDSLSTPASDTAKLESGYIYTECAYTTTSLS
ncbi:tol-pal system YbgF family protein [Streptomyces sp. NPDC000345]|uniref:tetratricopeptide repeat protein n=1 Tax=Streptomyces sp. NPDC000345 TaxID=3364537 RepID=UPI00369B5F02